MTPTKEQQRNASILLIVGVVLAVASIFLAIFGFGHIKNPLPNNTYQVRINGNLITDLDVKLRPGKYQVTVASSRYESTKIVKVGLFGTVNLTKPEGEQDASRILSRTIGASGLYGPPSATDTTWVLDDTWMVANVGPGSLTPIALHFNNNSWTVAYYDTTGYPRTETTLPTEARTALEGIKPSAQ